MKTIMFKGRAWPAYTVTEARSRGIDFLDDWRKGRKGDWIFTDDGFVVQILAEGKLGKRRWIRIAAGTFPVYPSSRLTSDPRPDRYSLNGKRTRGASRRAIRFGKLAAKLGDNEAAYRAVYPKANCERYISDRIESLMSLPAVQNAYAKELEDVRRRHGITPTFIVDEQMRLLRAAKNEWGAQALSLQRQIINDLDKKFFGGVSVKVSERFTDTGVDTPDEEDGIEVDSALAEDAVKRHQSRRERTMTIEGRVPGGIPQREDVEGEDQGDW